jgi:predicted Fe-S protein YdhL (DUF1289 family)
MLCKTNSLISVILLIVVISVSSCTPVPPETKESKLKRKRDELVEWKGEAEDRRRPIFQQMYESSYQSCLREQSLREEPKNCDKDKQELLEIRRVIIKAADDRIDEIRREIKELEQSESTNENSSK